MNISVRRYYQLTVALLVYLSLGSLSSVMATRNFTFKVDEKDVYVEIPENEYNNVTLGDIFTYLKTKSEVKDNLSSVSVLYKGNTEIKADSTGLLKNFLIGGGGTDSNNTIKLTTKAPNSPADTNNKNKGNKTNNNTNNNNNSGNDDVTDPDKADKKGIWANYKKTIIGGSIGGVILLSGVGLIFLGQSKQEKEKV